jgi:DNA-binding NtrC family response regulator
MSASVTQPASEQDESRADCVLIVEDDAHSLELTAAFVREAGGTTVTAATVTDAARLLDVLGDRLAFVITDIKLGDGNGLDLFRRVRTARPDLPVVLVTAFGSTDEAVAAMKEGAFYYFTKPVNFSLLQRLVRESLEKRALAKQVVTLSARLAAAGRDRILGVSPALGAALQLARNVAALDTTVLLVGETGTGKELFAEYIHELSGRRHRPLVAINCAALPEPLLESELFGHERGAFTGAVARKPGKFELARGGTVFLDEIGDLALPLQAKVLRALESKRIEPLGAQRAIDVDVRIIAATNRDLTALIEARQFREDLYYRLVAFPIVLPSLRDRREDVPLLAVHFLEQFARAHDKALDGFDAGALELLQAHAWPGNVRELRHAIERAVILANGRTVTREHLPLERTAAPEEPAPAYLDNLAHLKDLERDVVRRAVEAAGGNRTRAARSLGITRNQIRYRLRKMDPERS